MDLGDILKPHFEGKAVSPRMTGRVSADGQRKTERLLMHAASPRNPSWSSWSTKRETLRRLQPTGTALTRAGSALRAHERHGRASGGLPMLLARHSSPQPESALNYWIPEPLGKAKSKE